jgi:ferrous iron transport protein B
MWLIAQQAVLHFTGRHVESRRMSRTTDQATMTVALLGNPNTGKSTLFSALVGASQRIGNYPGVTVEKKVGYTTHAGHRIAVIDLPGTYSLAPRSLDEMVTVDVLLGRQRDVAAPDVIICILDATNLERNLYLVSQAMELGRPLILVLNKMDILVDRGTGIEVDALQQRLGVPVLPMQAHRRIGLESLKDVLVMARPTALNSIDSPLPTELRREVTRLQTSWQEHLGRDVPRFLAQRLLLDTGGYLEHADFGGNDPHVRAEVEAARQRLAQQGLPIPDVETRSRYQWVDEVLLGVVEPTHDERTTVTDHIDRVVTHRIGGTLIFLALMLLVFQAIFSWAAPFQALIEHAFAIVSDWFAASLSPGMVQSLLCDGVVAGVGAVLVFLPQIAMLFFFVALLEECGYMSRAAYLMDGMMARVGLSGKSFIPLLSSFACAVPGIMAARVIENRRDRFVTILVAPLMSCSARLPVYTLLIAAFIPDRRFLGGWLGLQGMTIVALYVLGIVVAVCVAKLLKRTLLKGDTPPFMMELPDYRIPSVRVVLRRVCEQSWAFLRGAGTLILAVTIVVWAAAYFPHSPQVEAQLRAEYAGQLAQLDRQLTAVRQADLLADEALAERLQELQQQRSALETTISQRVAGAYMQQSILGHLGRLIAPVVRPLGWDWRIGCAVIASFPAREVVIGAMGVIYNLGDGQDEESKSLKEKLVSETWPGTSRPIFTVPVALSIMVFFALCAQCAATLVVIKKETNSYRWPLFTFAYMTCLAYLGALLTYQLGSLI